MGRGEGSSLSDNLTPSPFPAISCKSAAWCKWSAIQYVKLIKIQQLRTAGTAARNHGIPNARVNLWMRLRPSHSTYHEEVNARKSSVFAYVASLCEMCQPTQSNQLTARHMSLV